MGRFQPLLRDEGPDDNSANDRHDIICGLRLTLRDPPGELRLPEDLRPVMPALKPIDVEQNKSLIGAF